MAQFAPIFFMSGESPCLYKIVISKRSEQSLFNRIAAI